MPNSPKSRRDNILQKHRNVGIFLDPADRLHGTLVTFFPTVTDAWENELVTDLEAMEPLDREELNDLQEFLARPLWRTSVNELYEFAETAGYWGYKQYACGNLL